MKLFFYNTHGIETLSHQPEKLYPLQTTGLPVCGLITDIQYFMVDIETNILIHLSALNLSKSFLNLFFNTISSVFVRVAFKAEPEVTSSAGVYLQVIMENSSEDMGKIKQRRRKRLECMTALVTTTSTWEYPEEI